LAVTLVSQVSITTLIHFLCNLSIIFSTHNFGKSSNQITPKISSSDQTIIGVLPLFVSLSISFKTSVFKTPNNFLFHNLTIVQFIFQTIHFHIISSKSLTSKTCNSLS